VPAACPTTDVQALLTVNGRRDKNRDRDPLALSRVCLADMDLTNADLTNADLTNADLTNADLTNADLTNADLTNADLSGANLHRRGLTSVDPTGTRGLR
jgi:uncharacterized protein YjbI with pentapeptide repeats